jgi:methionyl-tRNA formyltransferase
MRFGIICNHLFGLPSINFLANNNLIGGFAVPDLNHSALEQIKQFASVLHVPLTVLNKDNLTSGIEKWLNQINVDAVLIFSFPFKIPSAVLKIPGAGFINIHPSLLPAYKGADPIFYQLKDGISNSGITAHLVSDKIDSGKIICRELQPIDDNDNYGTLENKFAFAALRCANKLVNIISAYDLNSIAEEQNENESLYYRKPQDKDLVIDWNNYDAISIKNLVRACNPKYQGALTFFRNIPVKILEVSIENEIYQNSVPGQVLDTHLDGLFVASKRREKISIKVIYTNEGCFSGSLFKNIFLVQPGELFTSPAG